MIAKTGIWRGWNAGWFTISVFLAILAFRPYFWPETKAAAGVARYDYVYVISPAYLYQGRQGILLMDKRNGDVWFIAGTDNATLSFRDPVLVVRIPLEKPEQVPH
jgi:hypothetical protein